MIRIPGLDPDERDLCQVLLSVLTKESDRDPATADPWSELLSLGVVDLLEDDADRVAWTRRLFLVGYASGLAAQPTPLASVAAAAVLLKHLDLPIDPAAVVGTLTQTAGRSTAAASDGWTVRGTDVIEGLDVAEHVLFTAPATDAVTVLRTRATSIDRTHRGLRAESRALVDDVMIDATASFLGEVPTRSIADAVAIGEVVLAGEAVGLHERWTTATAEHLKTREQFGAPLAARQSTRHLLVEWWVVAEQLRALAWDAANSGADPTKTAVARLVGVRAAHAAATGIQLHGGVGMVDELPLGRSVRRLLEGTVLFAPASDATARFARSVLSRPRLTTLTSQ